MRPLRVVAHPLRFRRLVLLKIYQDFGGSDFRHSLLHYLSYPDYLKKGLSVRERTQLVLEHYTFESSYWSNDYHRAVYGGDGLDLWHVDTLDATFRICLQAGNRTVPEGDLRVTLMVGDEPLYRMNFNWMMDPEGHQIVPFITRAQAVVRNSEARSAFDRSFPQNSPAYFCYSAVQGLACLVGSPRAYGIRAHQQICAADGGDKIACFPGSYDNFWQSLGGTDAGGIGFIIPLPAHQKDLSNVPRQHRRRAQARRKNWSAIEASTASTITPYLATEFQKVPTPPTDHNVDKSPKWLRPREWCTSRS